jgi:hypothetical protein
MSSSRLSSVSSWQKFLHWCSQADRFPEIFHQTRDGQLARIYSGDKTLTDLVAKSLSE